MASPSNQLRIVLLGKTGNGKSATGNSLLHSTTAFHSTASPNSITQDCQKKSAVHNQADGVQKELIVVDTPGFFDTNGGRSNEKVQNTISSQIFDMTSPGVHAFLIVLRVNRYSPEEKNTVDFIKTIFGVGAAKYCIVVFTGEDQLEEGQTIKEFVNQSRDLRDFVGICDGRMIAINNKLNGSKLVVKTNKIIEMIEQMVAQNNGTYYTNEQYQRIERQRQAEKQRQEEQERKKKQEYEEELVKKAREEERQKAKKEQEEIERKHRKQMEDLEREENARRARLEQSSRSSNRGDLEYLMDGLSQMMRSNSMCGHSFEVPRSPVMSYEPSFMQHTMATPRNSGAFRTDNGSRFTGEYMVTNGSANGRPIERGPQGGLFYRNAKGNNTYLRKK